MNSIPSSKDSYWELYVKSNPEVTENKKFSDSSETEGRNSGNELLKNIYENPPENCSGKNGPRMPKPTCPPPPLTPNDETW